MADIAGNSSAPAKNNKPVIVRVKRKAFQSPVDAFWLEINGRPQKRPLIDFDKLSISQASSKVEMKTKKVFVQFIETLSNLDVNADVLRSFLPKTLKDAEFVLKSAGQRRVIGTESVLSKSARFEQVRRSRKGTKEADHDEALSEIYHLFDVMRVDVAGKPKELKEEIELEDHIMISSFLPLLKEVIPVAASEIESELNDYVSKSASNDDYVYDLYTVKDDTTTTLEDASYPFPLVQVNEDDDFYDGSDESENGSYDSNAEDNPMNEYPDEETSSDEEETQSRTSDGISDENSVKSAESSIPTELEHELLQRHIYESMELDAEEKRDDGLFEKGYEDDIYVFDDSDNITLFGKSIQVVDCLKKVAKSSDWGTTCMSWPLNLYNGNSIIDSEERSYICETCRVNT